MSNTPQQREKAVREVRVVKGGGGGDVGAVEGGDESGEEKVGSGEIWTIVKRILLDQGAAVGSKSGPPGPPRTSGAPKRAFWGQNKPFWGPQECRRGPLRGQSA